MACSRKGWRCQAKSDFSVFPHSVSCQATARAQAYSVQCFLANIASGQKFQAPVQQGHVQGSVHSWAINCAGHHQLSCKKTQPGKAFQMFTQLLFGGFLKSFLPNPHGWGTYEILESSFSLTVCSIFGFWSHSVDFADKRKLQNFIGMSQHGLESGCEQHLRIRLLPVFPT